MSKDVNELNFKDETIERIKSRQVREYYLEYLGSTFEKEGVQVYKGKGDINWDKIPSEYLEYYAGYGTQYWDGWITFKDSNSWLERVEYDGSEWWSEYSKPSLQNEEEYKDD